MWKHVVSQGGKEGLYMMKIRFIFSPEQTAFWENNIDMCKKRFTPELTKKIIASLESSEDGMHAVITLTKTEFNSFKQHGEPIKISIINQLSFPEPLVTL